MNWSRRLYMTVVGALSAATLSNAAWATEPQAPDALVKVVVKDVLAIFSIPGQDSTKVSKAIEEKIVDHFDFERMARLSVGKSWREANATQKQSIVEQFRTLLLRSYATAYSAARGVVVDVSPLKLQPSDEDVQVKSKIRLPGGAPPITMDYSMFKTPTAWKVYDVTVNEASLVSTYRTTFSEQIKQGGIDGLIKSLTEMNAKAATTTAKK